MDIELKGQPKDRHGTRLYDDFGRPYDVELDRRTMDPVGLPTPRFTAPFYVPVQHLKTKAGHLGRYFIDFAEWLQTLAEANREREVQRQALAKDMFPNNMAEALEHPERFPALERALGPSPLSDRFVRALRAGHPWATGELEADPATLTNKRGERIFSEADLASLARWQQKHQTMAQQLEDDADEFLPDGVEFGVPVDAADADEFGVEAPRKRGRPRKAA